MYAFLPFSGSPKYLRSGVATALGVVGKDAKDAIPALILTLQDKNEDVRSSAAYALGEIGINLKNTHEIINMFTAIVKNRKENLRTRFSSIEVLKKINSPEASLFLNKYQILVRYIKTLSSPQPVSRASVVKKAALSLANKNQLKACENNLANLLIGWKCPSRK